jgi:endonuclease-3
MISEKELPVYKKRATKVFRTLTRLFPDPKIALTFGNDWELLVAVQLSAQCTDKKVNEVTPTLFKKYKKLDDYVNAKPREFEKDIHQCGFYRAKTKNILAAAKVVKEKYHGKLLWKR